MSTVSFSVPADVKEAINRTFEGRNKSAVIAEPMREAVMRDLRRRESEAAMQLAARQDQHVFDTLYHAVALLTPDALLVTADMRYFARTAGEGRIVMLVDFEHES